MLLSISNVILMGVMIDVMNRDTNNAMSKEMIIVRMNGIITGMRDATMTKIVNSLRGSLLALFVTLQCAPLWAVEVGDAAKENTTSAPQDELAWMSGGIGDEARDEMRKAAIAYSVHLVFSDREGSYLAGIPFTVTRRNGHELYSGISAGPLLYLKLPPGSYQIAAKYDGVWHNKRVTAGTSRAPARVSFVSIGK